MSQTHLQVTALLIERKRSKASLEAQTQRLLAKRQSELDKMEDEATKHLKEIEEACIEPEHKLQEVQNKIDAADSTLISKQKEVDDVTNTVTLLDNKKSSLELIITDKENTVAKTETTIDDLKAQKTTLQDDITDLTDQLKTLTTKVTLQTTILDQLKQKTIQVEAQHQQELDALINKKESTISETKDIKKQIELERGDIATRTKAVDAREINIRVREYKVNEGEESIKRNANLLQL